MATETRYTVIYADPPWPEYGGGKVKRGADKHYSLMSVPAIQGLGPRVQEWAAADSFCFLWVTNNHLPSGLAVLEAWGFKYITNAVWCKPSIGLGHYFRGQHELILLGKRGSPPYSRRPNGSEKGRVVHPSVFHAPKGQHSAKPLSVQDAIETFSPGPYLELFARSSRMGWASVGDELGEKM